jgi:D-alanyl-D-alanine carboxypeptidase/D-alanyl-D-alanine-endopeptidase (penicillin-binding protein 4)
MPRFRFAILTLLFSLAPGLVLAQPLQGRVKKILKTHPRVHWGLYAVQAKNGKVLAKWNEEQFFVPASNTKLFSTSLALATFGPEHRLATRVLAAAPPDENGVVNGDLILYGEGDPTLSARNYPYNLREPFGADRLAPLRELARQLKAKNVRLVTGKLIGDDSYFEHNPIPPGWSASDGLYEYGAPVSALSFNDNVVTVKLAPGALSFDPAVPYFSVNDRTVAGERTRVRARRAPGSLTLSLTGTLKADAAYEDDFAVEDPALYAAMAFRVALEAEGIAVQGSTEARHEAAAAPETVELARRESPPMAEILRVADKVSQNLHCEMLLRAAEKRRKLEDFLREVRLDPGKDTYLLDGSGMSRQNLVSPKATVALLKHIWGTPLRDQFASFLPTGATDGTLRRRFNGNEKAKAIQAKTGTLSHVSALGGYAQSKKYGTVIFQIVANNFNEPSSGVLQAIDALALEFAR